MLSKVSNLKTFKYVSTFNKMHVKAFLNCYISCQMFWLMVVDIELSQIARKKNQPGKRKTFHNEIQPEDRYHHISNFTTSA